MEEKKMISRKIFIKNTILSGILLALSGCTDKSKDNSVDITFVLDYTPNTNHLGLYVAKHLGYYANAGLEVHFVQPPEDGADALVASGTAQFGISFQDWMASYLGSYDPLPVTAVAAIIQHNTSGIMSSADKNITRPRDMNYSTYGTLDVKTEQAIVRQLIEDDGGNFDTVKLVSANTTDEVSGLQSKQFESVWVYEGWGLQNAYLKKYPVNYFSISEQNPVFDFYTPVIIANNDYLLDNPDTVRAFLEATARGYAYASEHDQEAASILLEEVPELDADLVYASAAYLASRFIAEADRWGVIDEARWNAFYSWMNEKNLTDKLIPLSYGFTSEFFSNER